ncbi:hypothetical protein CKM354_000000500 [Cercospora kikuchii]|uniref:Flavin-containing monooxygenase n=1 Tax=Cercospora kikuchii TaxID=84275 RepID=A0A9P3C333_9PEZI|nr:uncharacterized protein CKM354_000000500 [Cercospora kikuchii]GIZ36534.1 hypothetical protein CKM354_000000500 [Cercospora kikuchii]
MNEPDHQVAPYAPDYTLQKLPASLPMCHFHPDLNVEAIAAPFAKKLPSLSIHDFSAEPIWRDVFALTGSLRTFYSKPSIMKAWSDTCTLRQATCLNAVPGSARSVKIDDKIGWVEIMFEFKCVTNPATRCTGFLCLILEGGSGKIWILRTVLEHLEGCGDVDDLAPKNTAINVINESLGADQLVETDKAGTGTDIVDCVIVGAGHAGLSCGGRLQALGVKYIILEKGSQIGATWIERYKSARLHTPREYNHLPFGRTFPDICSEYLTKDELVQGYRGWAHKFGIEEHVLLETVLDRGSWDPIKQLWTLHIRRGGIPQTVASRAVIMAVGSGAQIPIRPTIQGQADFKGTVLHSADYWSADIWKGKAGIVVGTANTAHDVAQDMVEAGLSTITMVQRTQTFVLPCEFVAKVIGRSYNAKIETHVANRAGYSMPNAVTRLLSRKALHGMADRESERFDALERAGFRCQRYGEMQWHLLERFGGHYIDVGCSKLIAEGKIKVKAGPVITKFTPEGLAFSDGTTISADIMVLCTGFVGNMRRNMEQIFDKRVADEVGDIWGLNEEGEVKGAYRRTGSPAIWCMAGDLPMTRYYSRHVALQVKAFVMGFPLPSYTQAS